MRYKRSEIVHCGQFLGFVLTQSAPIERNKNNIRVFNVLTKAYSKSPLSIQSELAADVPFNEKVFVQFVVSLISWKAIMSKTLRRKKLDIQYLHTEIM
jgi:hypothetical protein